MPHRQPAPGSTEPGSLGADFIGLGSWTSQQDESSTSAICSEHYFYDRGSVRYYPPCHADPWLVV